MRCSASIECTTRNGKSSFVDFRHLLIVAILSVSILGLLAAPVPANKPSTYPSWWFSRGAIVPLVATNASPSWPTSYSASDDYAVVNEGQFKNFASQAFHELQAVAPASVWSTPQGQALTAMVTGWSTTTGDDYRAINLGQAKTVAKPFYDVLIQIGYKSAYPWTGSSADDYSVANIGQIKNLFSFDVGYDSDGNGLPDWWEVKYFGQIGDDPNSSFDNDGVTLLQDYQQGIAPTWPNGYSAAVQAEIARNHWNQSQANAYGAFLATNPPIPPTGLDLWFKADAGVTKDANGNVTQWTDQRAGLIATQNSATAPSFVQNFSNSLPALSFNGTQRLSSTAYIPLDQDFTIVTVSSSQDTGSERYMIGIGNLVGSLDCRGFGNSSSNYFLGVDGNYTFGGPYLNTAEDNISEVKYSKTTSTATFYARGVQVGSGSVPTGATRSGFNIGDVSNGNYPRLWDGNIQEALVYNRVLTDAERQQAEGYLADKYGLYNTNATWPLGFTSDVQALIAANQWSKAQANTYVAQSQNSPVPSSGLALWLSADKGVTTDPSENVSSWQDQSPNGNNLFQNSIGARPVLTSAPGTSLPYLYFDEQGRYLAANNDSLSMKPASGVSIFAVHIPQNGSGAYADLISKSFNNTSWPPNLSYGLRSEGSQTLSAYLNNGSEVSAQSATDDYGRPQITSSIYDGSQIALYDDGAMGSSSVQSGALNYDSSGSPIVIGGTHAGSANWNWWKGYVGEVLIYNRALNTAEQQQVEVYLANKYKIYHPSATWFSSYSANVQAEIARNKWSKVQADNYVALQANNSGVCTTGLCLWIKADSGLTANTGQVTQVVDQTGNYILSQSNSLNQPAVVQNVLNGKPVLRFSSNQWLATTDGLGFLTSDMTVIAVEKNSNADSCAYVLYLGSSGTTGANRALGTDVNELFDTNGASAYGAVSSTSGAYAVETAVLNNTLSNVSFDENGFQTGSSSLNGAIALSSGITIGAAPGGTSGWQGDIAEELVYDHQLSGSELQQVGAYLSNRYNLPFNGTGPVISPSSGNLSTGQTVSISNGYPSGVIHYTLDGTAPTVNSAVFSSPFSLSGSALVSAAVFSISGAEVSQISSAQFYVNDPNQTGLPSSASGLSVSASGNQANLTWSLPGFDNYTGTEIYRSSDGGATYQLIASLAANANSFTDSSVQNGVNYQYEIATYNSSGETTTSASSTVSTSSSSVMTITITTPSGATPLP